MNDPKPLRPRRRGKPTTVHLPESNVPVEIAMETLEERGADVEVSRTLLIKQSRLVDWQIRTEQLRFATKIALALLAAIAAIVVSIMVVAALRSHEVIVQAFETPPSLAARGINGKVVASDLQDALAHIQDDTRTTANQRNISNEWTADINVEVPETGVSIGEIDRLLRQRLGRNTYVGGDLVQTGSGLLALRVRAASIPARTFTGPPDKLEDLARQAAEYIYGRSEPRLFASYLNQNNRYQDTLHFMEEAYSDAPEEQRASLANSWGNALSGLGHNPEALEKYRLAVELDPYRWPTWSNIVGVGMQTYGEAYAYSEAVKMRQKIADAPSDQKPKPGDQVNLNLLFQEWTDMTREQLLDAAASGGGTATTTNNTQIAGSEAQRHDWASANRYLVASDNSDPLKEPGGWYINGFRAIEAGRPAEAIPYFKKLDAAIDQSEDVAFAFTDGRCWLGLAYGLGGQRAEADAVFKRAGRWISCYAFKGDVLEAEGKHAEADAAYRQAVLLVPGLPFAYQRWGLTLLKRGDLRGAAQKFQQAQQRGPRWADPYEGLGEVALRSGQWAEADRQFKLAEEFAPHWGRMHRRWAVALSHLGKSKEAQAKLALARTEE